MRLKTFLYLIISALLIACKPSAESSMASHVNAAAHAEIADNTGAQLADGKKGQDETRKNNTLCANNENIVMSCAIEGENKIASICASKGITNQSGYVYYAFGVFDKPELIFPNDKSPPGDRFRRTHLFFAGATGGVAYSFANNGWKYIFYSISGTGFEDQGVMTVPVNADPNTKAKAALICNKASYIESDNVELRRYVNTWKADSAIDRLGLPPLSEKDSLARCRRQNSEDVCQN